MKIDKLFIGLDLSKYDKLMSGLVSSGINSINGVSFSSSKMEEYEAEARKKAVLDAKQKAEAGFIIDIYSGK